MTKKLIPPGYNSKKPRNRINATLRFQSFSFGLDNSRLCTNFDAISCGEKLQFCVVFDRC